jgi:hypothetical protein
MQVVWLGLVLLLVWEHRDRLLALKNRVAERLARRPAAPDPSAAPEAPPF